jgi:putative endonuclease
MRKMKAIKRKSIYYVYIVETSDGTYYTGYTNNLEKRLKEHGTARGAKYLRGRTPVKLVYAKEYRYYKNALHAERSLKGLRRCQKEELIKAYEKNNT